MVCSGALIRDTTTTDSCIIIRKGVVSAAGEVVPALCRSFSGGACEPVYGYQLIPLQRKCRIAYGVRSTGIYGVLRITAWQESCK